MPNSDNTQQAPTPEVPTNQPPQAPPLSPDTPKEDAETANSRRVLAGLIALFAIIVFAGLVTFGIIVKGAYTNLPKNSITTTASPTTTLSPTTTTTATPTPTQTTAPAALSVQAIDLSVSPNSIANSVCNSNLSFVYTTVFHLNANNAGGTINFMWTANNGRSSTNDSVTISPGETSKVYTFKTSGTLTSDNTYPGIAEVITSTPNVVHSAQVKPTGTCQ